MTEVQIPQDQIQTIVSTEALRAKIRAYTLQERADARASATDSLRFGLGEIKDRVKALDGLNEKDVHGLSTRIKRRKHATVEDMYRLSHAFLQSNSNINTFANTPGALQVLVKELTGTSSEHQISAVECLCNLSLGESHVSEKMSNAVGSYLVTYLDSSEERLKRTSLWTLANIIATSKRAAQTLMQMELLRKLWAIYIEDNDEYCEDAAICLQLIAMQSRDLFTKNERQFIVENFHNKNPTSAGGKFHLKIIYECELLQPQNMLEEQQILYLINCALSNVYFVDIKSKHNTLSTLYAVRTLANLVAAHQNAYDLLLQQLSVIWQSNLGAFFEKLFVFKEKEIAKESLWLLRNIVECQTVRGGVSVDSFLEKFHVPCNIFN